MFRLLISLGFGLSVKKFDPFRVIVCDLFLFLIIFFCCGNQLEQCGLRTPQCTIQGSIARPGDDNAVKVLPLCMFFSLFVR